MRRIELVGQHDGRLKVGQTVVDILWCVFEVSEGIIKFE